MSDARAKRVLPSTTEEFLAWPGDGWAKHYELVDGEVRAMSPGSAFHAAIQATLCALILQQLRASDSNHAAMIRPAVRPRGYAGANLRLPDIGLASAPVAAEQILVEDPILLVEILSPSNRAKTWTNVWAYTTIPSVREIVIVQSDRIEVQVLRSSADHIWPDNPETIAAGGMLRLDSIGFSCPVEEIYADTPLA